MPQVSVITSTHNRRQFLARALRTVLDQRDVDLEAIVVDNGSTDGTSELLSRIHDPRLRVIRNERSLGSVGGRNAGLQAASGTWVGFLDDDDLWAPDKLRCQLDVLSATGRSWAYAGCVHIDGKARIVSGRPPLAPEPATRALPRRFTIPGGMSNVIWRRGVLDEGGLLDPRLSFPADWDVSLRLSRNGLPALAPRPLVAYRQHGSNLSRDPARFADQLSLLERKRADLADGQPIDWGLQHRFIGSEELRAGTRLAAIRAFGQAVAARDAGSIPRAFGAVLPKDTQRWLHRRVLSDALWLEEAESWLAGLREL